MDEKRPTSGFIEVPHTADIALDVFAPDFPGLFIIAAKGLYHILGIRKGTGEPETVHFLMAGEDEESLLVAFLNELLYHVEMGLAAEDINLIITDSNLKANIKMLPKIAQQKEIKAATFNNLKIIKAADGLHARIVFDI